ncbi:OmpA family protein [Microbulbifer bruguierae]|uniref:OmpA family protein n=1 Tax=Microbulbifer bruguierae TaxID=3029061 RepID=A0ABY8NBE4_9GAMM|nr:OmpA family protein [Microbulbifer bruguierae]WGL15729.1 OmpA family protein [Microbulbifer bruguierae]
MPVFRQSPVLALVFFVLSPLLLSGCPDPTKKYSLQPRELVTRGLGELSARQAAPFGDDMVRYLMGQSRREGDIFVLRVDFEPGGFAPKMDTIEDIEALLVIMRDFPALKIAVEGHTDNAGDPDKNRKLSQWRADWVRQFLLERGISADRVEAAGLGDSDPVADNDTQKGREQNRRLVVRVLDFDGKPVNVRLSRESKNLPSDLPSVGIKNQ